MPKDMTRGTWMLPRGDRFTELFENAGQWPRTREILTGVGFADHVLNNRYSDEQLQNGFREIRRMGLGLALEVGAVKEWGTTGEKVFAIQRKFYDRFLSLGAEITALAFDEPLVCVGKIFSTLETAWKTPMEYAVAETAAFIRCMREHYPSVQLGDIEAYPFLDADYIIEFIDRLEEYLRERGIPGQDFFRLDVDWNAIGRTPEEHRRHWLEVRRIEDHCRKIGMPFSLIYWAADVAASPELQAEESSWYNSIMRQGEEYAAVGGAPDQIVVQTWIPQIPPKTIPETDPWSFTRSVLDFHTRFAAAGDSRP